LKDEWLEETLIDPVWAKEWVEKRASQMGFVKEEQVRSKKIE